MHSGASREILDLGQPELGCWFRTSQVRNTEVRDFAPPDFEDVRHRTSAGREMTSAIDNSRATVVSRLIARQSAIDAEALTYGNLLPLVGMLMIALVGTSAIGMLLAL